MFSSPGLDIVFDTDKLFDHVLGLINDKICESAEQAYDRSIGRLYDSDVWDPKIPDIPGLDVNIKKKGGDGYNFEFKKPEKPRANPLDEGQQLESFGNLLRG